MKVWGLWCEYDYGQDAMVFYNKKDLRDWFNKQVMEVEGDEWADYLFNRKENERLPWDLFDREGLAGYKEKQII